MLFAVREAEEKAAVTVLGEDIFSAKGANQ